MSPAYYVASPAPVQVPPPCQSSLFAARADGSLLTRRTTSTALGCNLRELLLQRVGYHLLGKTRNNEARELLFIPVKTPTFFLFYFEQQLALFLFQVIDALH